VYVLWDGDGERDGGSWPSLTPQQSDISPELKDVTSVNDD
jgi:hypothetical protein